MTKQEIINKINTYIVNNSTKRITACQISEILSDIVYDYCDECTSGSNSGSLDIPFFYSKTYNEVNNLKISSSLEPGAFYYLADKKILIQTTSNQNLSLEGTVWQYCPTQYTLGVDANGNNWKGVFSVVASSVPQSAGLIIWGGKVWRKINNSFVFIDNDFTLSGAHITLIDPLTATNGEYILKTFGCEYDFENDWIQSQWDNQGNIISCSKALWTLTGGNINYNPCISTDWNMPNLLNNKASGIYNNISSFIALNNCKFSIKNNVCLSITDNNIEIGILNNTVTNGIYRNNVNNINLNTCLEISRNENNGIINNNTANSIIGNENNGDITAINDNTVDVLYCKYNGAIDGSVLNITDTIDWTTPKIITSNYTLSPWDYYNIYRPTANMTVFLPDYTPITHSSMHLNDSTFDIQFAPILVGGLQNVDSHTKIGDRYSLASITMIDEIGKHILGGRTKA